MASGKTEELNDFDRLQGYRVPRSWQQKARDRSLRGKARRKARKERNKLSAAASVVETNDVDDS